MVVGYARLRRQRCLRQIVIRDTGLPGTDHLQRVYVVHCAVCTARTVRTSTCGDARGARAGDPANRNPG